RSGFDGRLCSLSRRYRCRASSFPVLPASLCRTLLVSSFLPAVWPTRGPVFVGLLQLCSAFQDILVSLWSTVCWSRRSFVTKCVVVFRQWLSSLCFSG